MLMNLTNLKTKATKLNLDISQSVDLRIVNSTLFVELLIFLQITQMGQEIQSCIRNLSVTLKFLLNRSSLLDIPPRFQPIRVISLIVRKISRLLIVCSVSIIYALIGCILNTLIVRLN